MARRNGGSKVTGMQKEECMYKSDALSQGSVEAAIREWARQYKAAYNTGDADVVGAIDAVDGTHLNTSVF